MDGGWGDAVPWVVVTSPLAEPTKSGVVVFRGDPDYQISGFAYRVSGDEKDGAWTPLTVTEQSFDAQRTDFKIHVTPCDNGDRLIFALLISSKTTLPNNVEGIKRYLTPTLP